MPPAVVWFCATLEFLIRCKVESSRAHTIQVPAELFEKFLQAGEAIDRFSKPFEDFLIFRNPKLLRELRQARREHLAGQTRPFEEFQQELVRNPKRR